VKLCFGGFKSTLRIKRTCRIAGKQNSWGLQGKQGKNHGGGGKRRQDPLEKDEISLVIFDVKLRSSSLTRVHEKSFWKATMASVREPWVKRLDAQTKQDERDRDTARG